ncbi:hypothetical protein H2200_011445 [Cladophialophora chaetospira]|uniref:Apple domain-containing protein n=1 Tax=Cladophialophora chaetospira TaxID=386627 RepID=A0AA39CD52_9EURO|nr:hypothetical protein H2200_011445 [Cladophialophora chaetospira]
MLTAIFAIISLAVAGELTYTRTHYTCPCNGLSWDAGEPTYSGIYSSSSTSTRTGTTTTTKIGITTTSPHWGSTSSYKPGHHGQCYTVVTSTSTDVVKTTTTTVTSTSTITDIDVITPTTTITPAASTTTETITNTFTDTTTASQETDTATEESTTTTTTTTTLDASTETSTTFTTSTTIVSGTTTVPTRSGFLPVRSTLPNSASKKKKRQGDLINEAKRVEARSKHNDKMSPNINDGDHGPESAFPAFVVCRTTVIVTSTAENTATDQTTLIDSITVTGATTVTSTAPTPVSTTTETEETTSTSTIYPTDATTTTTVTITTTATDTSTPPAVTTTSTSTLIETAYISTSYAACATNNIVGTLNGYGITQVQSTTNFPDEYNRMTTNDASSYACCVSCVTNPNCLFDFFYPGFAPGSQCYVVVTAGQSQCSAPGQYEAEADYDTSFPPDTGYFLSNGNCGIYDIAGEA